jgi:hypothetical protein
MRLLVNHLTRMAPGFVCVAGFDPDSKKHVRPVIHGRLSSDLLERFGGPFDIANLVELGEVTPTGTAPELEDNLFEPTNSSKIKSLDADRFWRVLQALSGSSLSDVFGDVIQYTDASAVVGVGLGERSLGCLTSQAQFGMYISAFDKIRLTFEDEGHALDLGVTDARLHAPPDWQIREDRVEEIAARLRHGERVILSLGLSRAFQKKGDTVRRHWLQVNNIHLEGSPVWNEHSETGS